jgi:hypothetical protein
MTHSTSIPTGLEQHLISTSNLVILIGLNNLRNMSTSNLNRLISLSCRAKPMSRNAHKIARSRRAFCVSASRQTDGVFRELTAMRIPTPWIEAFNKRKEQEEREKSGVASSGSSESGTAGETSSASSKAQTPLPPKRMSDSYHSVVSRMPYIYLLFRAVFVAVSAILLLIIVGKIMSLQSFCRPNPNSQFS